ncbi:hypothetical protein ACIBO9_28315 [Streptomyces prunicolor]|uniref:hypothetical protein n=1 Tax=Streptomyces prunicolor TaxID=67348 RepID=UPI0037D92616
MEAELAALAASGATTLMALMVSESWEQAKGRLTRFLARRRSDEESVGELQLSSEELSRARAEGDAVASADIEDRWQRRLLDVLHADPDAAAELRGLLAELGDLLPRTVGSGRLAEMAGRRVAADEMAAAVGHGQRR